MKGRANADPSADERAGDCFHCGLPIPSAAEFRFEAADGWRRFCCAGCEAVSRSISGLGLDDYYRLRDAPAATASAEGREDLCAFDDERLQARFVRDVDGMKEAQLLVEGLRCAACAWLIEQVAERIPGVASASMNFATRRATLRWDPAALELSEILARIRAIGYDAWPYEAGRLALIEARERRTLLRRLWVAGLGMMQVMMYAVPAYLAGEGEMTADIESLMRWAGLLLTVPVLGYSAAPFFVGAWRDMRLARLGMEFPVALGIAVAFAASAWATVAGRGEVYFDSVTMFVFLLLGGRYLELLARARAGQSLQHLGRLVPQTANRIDADGRVQAVAVTALAPGDRVQVRAGETVPADGALASERATLGEAWLSGESRPLARSRGERVLGGSVNAGSAFVLQVERVGSDTALSSIHRLMERALDERPEWVEAAQRAARVFVGFVLVGSLAAALAWLRIDPSQALWIAVSVLIVTCPCALALATPVAMTVATGAMARRNVVIARGHAVEALAQATHFVFDKTGTLTEGSPRLVEVVRLRSAPEGEVRNLAASMARLSSHPLDRALEDAAPARFGFAVAAHESVAGAGIEARIAGRRLRMGRLEYVRELHGRAAPVAWISDAHTVVWLADEAGWIAAFRLADTVRPEAARALARLRALGVSVHLLSGDEAGATAKAAEALGIEDYEAAACPERKMARVRELQAAGARVAMVGDGINDAPVLASADVSIAMGGGADLAQVHADAVLLSNSMDDLVRSVELARRARGVIRQNLAWALAYNLVVVPLAFAGLVTPVVAGIGMSASSLAVVLNALRVGR